jgi:hypothetical protein
MFVNSNLSGNALILRTLPISFCSEYYSAASLQKIGTRMMLIWRIVADFFNFSQKN